jgi:hypothetical protein
VFDEPGAVNLKQMLSRHSNEVDMATAPGVLKEIQKELVEKSKQLRNQRQTSFYSLNDYYVYETPSLSDLISTDSDLKAGPEVSLTKRVSALSLKLRESSMQAEQMEQRLESYVSNLKIYGGIKTISPSEYFLCHWSHKSSPSKERLMVIKIDKNCASNSFSAEISDLADSFDP